MIVIGDIVDCHASEQLLIGRTFTNCLRRIDEQAVLQVHSFVCNQEEIAGVLLDVDDAYRLQYVKTRGTINAAGVFNDLLPVRHVIMRGSSWTFTRFPGVDGKKLACFSVNRCRHSVRGKEQGGIDFGCEIEKWCWGSVVLECAGIGQIVSLFCVIIQLLSRMFLLVAQVLLVECFGGGKGGAETFQDRQMCCRLAGSSLHLL